MKAFILCGGYGTRLDDEGKLKAKPMVKIGNNPILIHLIRFFCKQNIKDFVFCLGYKSNSVINYFIKENKKKIVITSRSKNLIQFKYKSRNLNFNAALVFTGIKSGTGGRIAIAYKKLKLDEDFLMTYGDGLSNVSIKKLTRFHYKNKSDITLTAVRPKQRYGILDINKNRVKAIDNSKEKKVNVYINGGFFIISKKMVDKIKSSKIFWENEPLNFAVKKKKLFAYKHEGFWKSLDTLKDKNDFNELLKKKNTPWIT
jgi:glucose-1-phosphate cytidylyltransferase